MEFPFILKHKTFGDDRGNFCPSLLNMKDDPRLDKNWVQVNTSISPSIHTVRGLHFQIEPFEQAKYLKVVSGKIFQFVMCVEKVHFDFGKTYIFEVDKNHAVMVPRGYANGLITVEPNTVVQYFVDSVYSPQHEKSMLYSSVEHFDLFVKNFTNNPMLSDKDRDGFLWDDYKKTL
jgi:dTDP-4-dehydrorhamnose 3,5-epimerase